MILQSNIFGRFSSGNTELIILGNFLFRTGAIEKFRDHSLYNCSQVSAPIKFDWLVASSWNARFAVWLVPATRLQIQTQLRCFLLLDKLLNRVSTSSHASPRLTEIPVMRFSEPCTHRKAKAVHQTRGEGQPFIEIIWQLWNEIVTPEHCALCTTHSKSNRRRKRE